MKTRTSENCFYVVSRKQLRCELQNSPPHSLILSLRVWQDRDESLSAQFAQPTGVMSMWNIINFRIDSGCEWIDDEIMAVNSTHLMDLISLTSLRKEINFQLDGTCHPVIDPLKNNFLLIWLIFTSARNVLLMSRSQWTDQIKNFSQEKKNFERKNFLFMRWCTAEASSHCHWFACRRKEIWRQQLTTKVVCA